MNLLHVDSSILGDHSVSRQISSTAVAGLRAAIPGLDVVYRDLDATPAPHQSGALLAARGLSTDRRSPEQARDVAHADAILDEFLAADIVVIGVPMYNFGTPASSRAGSITWRWPARRSATPTPAWKAWPRASG